MIDIAIRCAAAGRHRSPWHHVDQYWPPAAQSCSAPGIGPRSAVDGTRVRALRDQTKAKWHCAHEARSRCLGRASL